MAFGAAFGADALGLLVGNLSGHHGTTDMYNQRQREDAQHDYLERELRGIQSRVAGAQAAGLHPLAALGFQSGPGGFQPVGHTMPTGGRLPDPPREDPEMRAAQIRLMNAQSADHETQALQRSNVKLATQPSMARPMVTDSDNLEPGQGLRSGIKIEPSKITAGKNGIQAGTHQGAVTVRIPTGNGSSRKMLVPGGELSQGLEDLEFVKTLITIAMNRGEIADFFTGDIPWAARGYLKDWGLTDKKSPPNPFSTRGRKGNRTSRSGGATGSW